MTGSVRPRAAGALLVALLALLGLTGCAVAVAGEPAPAAATGDYRDPQGRFALALPPGWTRDPSHPGPAIVFLDAPAVPDPLARLTSPAIEVRVLDWPGDLGRAVDTFHPTLGARGPAAFDEPVTLPDGTPAHLFGDTVPDGLGPGFDRRELQVYAVTGGRLVTVTARGETGDWNGYGEPLFDTAVRSLTVGP
ncbi:hypothetical protein [Pseudonocardia humida]|uniref:Lipoprotein LpqN n=1 Tax=Pseudonocardia humida TaxID=2800819 RepID=A0ABT1A1V9_9PSEU|nr:hypothetical protein [Pseudonocardia humida]MCO1656794.1 hypothetical protein [Pseudonocardia humida]